MSYCIADCSAGTDSVWNIEWPFATAGTTVSVSCGPHYIGTVRKKYNSYFYNDEVFMPIHFSFLT